MPLMASKEAVIPLIDAANARLSPAVRPVVIVTVAAEAWLLS